MIKILLHVLFIFTLAFSSATFAAEDGIDFSVSSSSSGEREIRFLFSRWSERHLTLIYSTTELRTRGWLEARSENNFYAFSEAMLLDCVWRVFNRLSAAGLLAEGVDIRFNPDVLPSEIRADFYDHARREMLAFDSREMAGRMGIPFGISRRQPLHKPVFLKRWRSACAAPGLASISI